MESARRRKHSRRGAFCAIKCQYPVLNGLSKFHATRFALPHLASRLPPRSRHRMNEPFPRLPAIVAVRPPRAACSPGSAIDHRRSSIVIIDDPANEREARAHAHCVSSLEIGSIGPTAANRSAGFSNTSQNVCINNNDTRCRAFIHRSTRKAVL